MALLKKSWGWMRKNKWAFQGIGAALLGATATLVATRPASPRPSIQQHSEAPNSPNIVGASNVVNYAAEPQERLLPSGFTERLSAFSGQHFWLMTETNDYDEGSEQMRFGRQLASALEAAGWKKTQNTMMKTRNSTEFKELPQPLYVRIGDRGIIAYASGSSIGAAEALRNELRRGLTKAELALDEGTKDIVVVVVGLQ